MQHPCLLVVGHPHHGKTEFRKILSKLTYMRGESTSTLLYRFLALRRNVSLESLQQLPKEEIRPALIAAGDWLVGQTETLNEVAVNDELDKIVYRIPSGLIRTLYQSGYNVIDGVRRKQELAEARKHLDWNGVRNFVFWVERPGEPILKDNTELTKEDADEIIINDGTLEDLEVKATAILTKLFGPQDKPKPLDIFDSPAAASAQAKISSGNVPKIEPSEL